MPMEANADKVNILLVDDEPKDLLALESVLSGIGQNVVTASSGQAALRQVLETDFAVILLDVHMPGLDGFETAALIREREQSKETPIIFLTASMVSDSSLFKGYSVGAVDYLFKPVIPEVLKAKVETFVDIARKTAQLKTLNIQLRDQTERLAMANRELEAFSYSVSHDLHAPLRYIRGFCQCLVQECAQALPPVGQDYLARIDKSAQKMNQLIEDLLGLARVASAEVKRAPVDLGEMAKAIAADFQVAMPERHVDFMISEPLVVQGDSNLLRIALQNLLSNAWKYTGIHEHSTIEVGKLVEADATVYYVRDDGIGFDMKYADKLFVPFQRLHAQKDFEGSGIGLATVRRIVNRHGGRIWAEGNSGKGAAFYFTL